jgi:hypothetical protein
VAAQQRPLETAVTLPAIGAERRRDLELRAVFDEVYARVESFFDTSQSWGGSELTLLVYRVVRQSHPQLDALQVQTLVTAMQRVYRGRHSSGTQRRPFAAPADEPA